MMKDIQSWMLVVTACSAVAASISAVAASIALIFNRRAIREATRTRELQIFHDIFQEIKGLEEKQKEYKTDNEKKAWNSLFFNTLEYFSFLINKAYLSDRRILSFFEDAIAAWYEQIFLKRASKKEQEDEKVYPEVKKLYKTLKSSRN